MKRLKCPYCGYEWNYKGVMNERASCPNCRRGVKISDNQIDQEGGDDTYEDPDRRD